MANPGDPPDPFGATYPVTFPTPTTWEATVPVASGSNVFVVTDGVDTLTVEVLLEQGAAAGHAGAQATMRTSIPLAGQAGGQAGAQATPGAKVALGGAAGGKAGAGATPAFGLKGAAGGQGGGQASPGAVAQEAGGAGGHAGGVSALRVDQPLAGEAGGHADPRGGIAGGVGAEAVLTLRLAAASGEVSVFFPRRMVATALSGSAAIAIGASGGSLDVPLGGEAGGHAGATAIGPQVAAPLRGAAGGHAGGAAIPAGQVQLRGVAGGHADGQGTLPKPPVPLSGRADGHAGAAGQAAGVDYAQVGRIYFWNGERWV